MFSELVAAGDAEFATHESRSAWMKLLRAETSRIDLIFNAEDKEHPFIARFAHLEIEQRLGVQAGHGYSRPRPRSSLHRYAYDRELFHAIDELGGLFAADPTHGPFSALGDVDVVFVDSQGVALGATVAHERMILTSKQD